MVAPVSNSAGLVVLVAVSPFRPGSVYTTLTCWAARLSALSRRSWRLRSPDPAAARGSHPRGAASVRLPPGPGAPDRNGCGRCLAQSRPTAVSRVPPSHSTHRSAAEQAHPWRRPSPAPELSLRRSRSWHAARPRTEVKLGAS